MTGGLVTRGAGDLDAAGLAFTTGCAELFVAGLTADFVATALVDATDECLVGDGEGLVAALATPDCKSAREINSEKTETVTLRMPTLISWGGSRYKQWSFTPTTNPNFRRKPKQ